MFGAALASLRGRRGSGAALGNAPEIMTVRNKSQCWGLLIGGRGSYSSLLLMRVAPQSLDPPGCRLTGQEAFPMLGHEEEA